MMPAHPRLIRLLARAACWCLAGVLCASPRASPLVIPVVLRDSAPVDARSIGDYAAAVDAIVSVLARKLGLPVPRYTLEIHATRESFEAALASELKLGAEMARNTAAFAKAAVGNYKILVNETAMSGSSWPQRVLTLAHELGHATQLELGDHRRWKSRQQWLVEAFAEWIAFQVADALGFDEISRARARMIAELRESRRAGTLPELYRLGTLEQWVATQAERGFRSTYPMSFLVMDFLVSRHSFAAVVDFFRSFRSSADPDANFLAAFGEDTEAFRAALQSHFDELLE